MKIGMYLAEDNVRRLIEDICQKLGWSCSYYTDLSLDHFVNVKDFDVFIVNEFWTRIVCRQLLHYDKAGELPCVYTSKGFLPGTQIFDAYGYDNESWIYPQIPSLIERYLDPLVQIKAESIASKIIEENVTHYHQSYTSDSIPDNSVFLPMQVSIDFSILKSPIVNQSGYGQYLDTVARFCSDHRLNLAIKLHPVSMISGRTNILKYLERYPTDKITEECIDWHDRRFSDEFKWTMTQIDGLKKKYRNISIVEGNINQLCLQSLFIATVSATTCFNACLTKKVISTCGNTLFGNSGTVVNDVDPYIGLLKAYESATKVDKLREQKQIAMVYLLLKDFFLVDETFGEFYGLNNEKILRQIFLSIHKNRHPSFDFAEVNNPEEGKSIFKGQWDSVKSLHMNSRYRAGQSNRIYYPNGVIAVKNMEGYDSVTIKPGDSLWSLFGDKWKYILNLEVNKVFREEFPNSNYIFPDYIIYVPKGIV